MSSGAIAKEFIQFTHVSMRNYSMIKTIFNSQKVTQLRGCLYTRPFYRHCSTLTSNNGEGSGSISISYHNGLPTLAVPLPSRKELCQFTLKPVTNTLSDFVTYIQLEDKGVDRVAAYNKEGVRIAGSTSIDVLLQKDFDLVLNGVRYNVSPPSNLPISSSEHTMNQLSEIKASVASLYSALNVEQHQLLCEAQLQEKLEDLKQQMQPYQELQDEIAQQADQRTQRLKWLGLGLMGLQFGVLARLTWWEYSWDIMEPVTYFVTYGTSMAMFAYYVVTKQEYTFPAVRDREFLLTVHKLAAKRQLDLGKYNELSDAIAQTEYDIQRLRDPLQLKLPIQPTPAKHKDMPYATE